MLGPKISEAKLLDRFVVTITESINEMDISVFGGSEPLFHFTVVQGHV
jgi:hypothetical protein